MGVKPTDLAGAWRYDREIEDRLAGETSRIEGEAQFATDVDGRIAWRETGEWARPHGPVRVHRNLWLEDRAGEWWVTFEDGRDFHPWTSAEPVEHPCGRDVYTGRVTPGPDQDHWSLEWVASGPEKDYTMRTAYTRA